MQYKNGAEKVQEGGHSIGYSQKLTHNRPKAVDIIRSRYEQLNVEWQH